MPANWISFDEDEEPQEAPPEQPTAVSLFGFLHNLGQELTACEEQAAKLEALLSDTVFQSATDSLAAPWQLQSLDLLRQILGDLAMATVAAGRLPGSREAMLDPAALSLLKLARVRKNLMTEPSVPPETQDLAAESTKATGALDIVRAI